MKNYIKNLNILIGLLLFCVPVQGMEDKKGIESFCGEFTSMYGKFTSIDGRFDSNKWFTYGQYHVQKKPINYNDLAALAKRYNNKHKMICLPQEPRENIYMHCAGDSKNKEENLKQHIKTMLSLRSVCKHFNNILSGEKIGQVCASYEKNVKDGVFAQVVDSVNDVNYWRKRFPCLILVYAGVHPDSFLQFKRYSLLIKSIYHNDLELSKIMLEHGADINRKTTAGYPIFFKCETKEMAKLLIKYNVNVHQINKDVGTDVDENILWYILSQHHFKNFLSLLTFYIEQDVDVKMLRNYDNACLLHVIHKKSGLNVKDSEAVERAKILLPKMPDMINAHDKKGRTPLDKILKNASKYPKLIALFRKHDAKTAQELQAEQNAQKQNGTQQEAYKASECFICFDIKEKMMKVPCINNKGINNHTEEICVDCYENCLKHSNLCPLCRAKLKK